MPKWHDHELWNTSSDHAAAVTNHLEVAAPGTGKTLIISWFAISVGSPASNICLLDGSGGAVLLEFYLAQNGNIAGPCHIELTTETGLYITTTGAGSAAVNFGGSIEEE